MGPTIRRTMMRECQTKQKPVHLFHASRQEILLQNEINQKSTRNQIKTLISFRSPPNVFPTFAFVGLLAGISMISTKNPPNVNTKCYLEVFQTKSKEVSEIHSMGFKSTSRISRNYGFPKNIQRSFKWHCIKLISV